MTTNQELKDFIQLLKLMREKQQEFYLGYFRSVQMDSLPPKLKSLRETERLLDAALYKLEDKLIVAKPVIETDNDGN